MKHGFYALGATQWKCLHVLLTDGGQLTTAEIAEAIGHSPKRTRTALVALADRNLLRTEIVKGPTPPTTLWAIKVAREQREKT